MPVQVTYPGVYIEELPSGQHQIAGVPTSITAFVGRAVKGPTNDPTTIHNFANFERMFGGLHKDYPLSYAVQDFFMNGGYEALIVRLYKTPTTAAQQFSIAPLTINCAGWRSVVEAAQSIPLAGLATLFDNEGHVLATLPTATAVYQTALSKAQQIITSGTAQEIQAAQYFIKTKTLAPVVNETTQATLTKLFHAVPNAISSQYQAIVLEKQNVALKTFSNSFTSGSLKPGTTKEILATPFTTVGEQATLLPVTEWIHLEAMDEGAWGSYLDATIDTNNITTAVAKAYTQYGLKKSDLFNLTIKYQDPITNKITQEQFNNVTIKKPQSANDANYILLPNRLDIVLENSSILVRAARGEKATAVANFPDQLTSSNAMGHSLKAGDSDPLTATEYLGNQQNKTGLYALDKAELFNLLCIPPDIVYPESAWKNIEPRVLQTAANYCMHRKAFLIIDPPNSESQSWSTYLKNGELNKITIQDLGIVGEPARYAAVYVPLVEAEDPLRKFQARTMPICGIIAGIIATTDMARGVWQAPAGMEAAIQGITGLKINMNNAQNGILNSQAINALRSFNVGGTVVWGALTLRGQDTFADVFKYIPVRRLANYIELSLQSGTQWAIFEPNSEPLWSALRISIGGFLKELMNQGAILNYQVACDAQTTTPDDQLKGLVNVLIRYTPNNPNELIALHFQIVGVQQLE